MTLTDQQLRQELVGYGETVPPITQRNREQLRARLDVLRTQKRPRIATGSPSRTRPTASPSRARASVDSPSRTRATASPSRAATAGSPSRARASSTTATSTTSLTRTRSKQTPNLIELSDSDNEAAATGALKTRSAQATGNVQTRSNAPRRAQKSPTSLSPTGGASAHMTNDVEESIARHRREIKQLLDSARDRSTVSTPGPSSLRSGHTRESPGKSSSHRGSPSPTSKSRAHRRASKSDHESDGEDTAKRSSKSDHRGGKSSSPARRGQKSCSSCCKTLGNFVKNLLKVLLVGSVLWAAGTFLLNQYEQTVPHREMITCSVKDATKCEDMRPVIAAVRKQLQVRAGEVDCGFRDKAHILVTRPEIEQYLSEKGLKFQGGDAERWRTLLTYIKDKPVSDITMWTAGDQPTNQTTEVQKLSTKEAERSLICRARQLPSKTLRNLAYLLLGSTGLLTVAWFLHKHTRSHEENENTIRDYLGKAVTLLKEQYEKHAHDHNTQPWLAIDYIRDKLIPEKDQERLQHIWERVKSEISKQDSRIRSELQEIDGKASDVWRWVKSAASPKNSKTSAIDESDPQSGSDVGLTQCLKLRNCFRSEDYADDDEIDHVVDSIQTRCASVKRIEHIGIHSVFVYLKFSSKEAAAQGYHLLNNWHYQDRTVNVKYIRLNRYYEHFPEAQDAGTSKE